MKTRFASLLVTIALVAGCGSGTHTSAIPSGGQSSSVKATSTTTTTAAPAATVPAGCAAVAKPQPKSEGTFAKPALKLDKRRTYVATVKTNCGTFAFKLDPRTAPNAAASISFLASKKFFDGTVFHRIALGFVIQGGDPTGSGGGGPGYSTVDKPPRTASYTRGVVAMAKTGTEPAGTAGSQFFVVTGADAGLPADYAIAGKVTKGLDVVARIGKLGDQSQQPTTTVEILSLRVKRS
jgi:cyclophilin family peptidyl-prolyl cis-trans isomerase